jgi:hypothetical protein
METAFITLSKRRAEKFCLALALDPHMVAWKHSRSNRTRTAGGFSFLASSLLHDLIPICPVRRDHRLPMAYMTAPRALFR